MKTIKQQSLLQKLGHEKGKELGHQEGFDCFLNNGGTELLKKLHKLKPPKSALKLIDDKEYLAAFLAGFDEGKLAGFEDVESCEWWQLEGEL